MALLAAAEPPHTDRHAAAVAAAAAAATTAHLIRELHWVANGVSVCGVHHCESLQDSFKELHQLEAPGREEGGGAGETNAQTHEGRVMSGRTLYFTLHPGRQRSREATETWKCAFSREARGLGTLSSHELWRGQRERLAEPWNVEEITLKDFPNMIFFSAAIFPPQFRDKEWFSNANDD